MTKSFTECPGEDLLVRYVDQALQEWETGSLEEHLATCDNCAERSRELNRFRQMWEVLRDPHEPVFLGLERDRQPDPSLMALIKELGGRVWSVAKLVYKLPEQIPELIPSPAFTNSPFDQFARATASEPSRTLGSAPTGKTARRGLQTRALARSTGHRGRQEIQIVFDDKTRETLVLLNNWTGGPPPRLAVSLIPSDSAEDRKRTFSIEWVKVRPGHFRAALPPSFTVDAEMLIGFGPSETEA